MHSWRCCSRFCASRDGGTPAGASIIHNHRLEGKAAPSGLAKKAIQAFPALCLNRTHEPYVVVAANSIDLAAQARWFMQIGPGHSIASATHRLCHPRKTLMRRFGITASLSISLRTVASPTSATSYCRTHQFNDALCVRAFSQMPEPQKM